MADPPAPPAPPPAPPLIGREREQAMLRGALAAALAGRGSLVLIGGEAGIGKTALAEAALAEAQERGALVLVGRCYDLAETPPYGPWRETFDRAPATDDLPTLPAAVLPPDHGGEVLGSQEAIFARVRAYLAALAARRPLVLLLDDLHWADPASLDLLRVLGRQLAGLPILIIATYRADELTRRHPLSPLLPALVREARAARLDVPPLDEAGLWALVQGRYALPALAADRLVAYLRDRAEGNPFFTGELLRMLEERRVLRREPASGWALGDLAGAGVPPLLRQVIDARADRLGEAARELLAVAAVLGQEVPLELWGVVAAIDEARLLDVAERAADARLLVPAGAGLRFAHALIREALYEGTLPPRRSAWHRLAGEALAARPRADPDAVAFHFRQAGDERAAAWLAHAGERAHRAYAWETAAARFEAALALLEQQGAAPAERGWLLARLVRVWTLFDAGRGLAVAEAALATAAVAGDPALDAYAQLVHGHLQCMVGAGRRGLPELAAAADAIEALGEADLARLAARLDHPVADLRAARGTWLLQAAVRGDYAAVLAWADRWAAWPPPPLAPGQDGSFYGNGWHGLACALAACGEPDRALDAFARAAGIARTAGHHFVVGQILRRALALAVLPYRADDLAERRRAAAAIAAAAARVHGEAAPWVAWADAPLRLVEGRWGDDLRRALEVPVAGLSDRRFSALGPLHRAQGRPGAARALAWEALPAGAATAPGDVALAVGLAHQREAAQLALDAGDLPTARAWLEAHDRWLIWSGSVLGRAEGALGWAAYHRAAGDPAAARRQAEAALARATEPRQPLALLAAHRLLGELATAAGAHGEAAAHLDRALELADACATPYERALTLLARAGLHAAAGRPAEAADPLAEARATFAALGATPALADADALVARLAAAPAPAALPAGLSMREAEVLRLVANGLTNAQVAERLFLSPRTVNGHLTAIYGKLGVASRAAAIRYALDHLP